MNLYFDIILDALRTTILISGMVVVMMLMIESLNIGSKGRWAAALRRTRTGQVVVSAILGCIPGCMGGFASVSLYNNRMISFGALVAMLIATSGDEAFIMLGLFPKTALMLTAALLVIAVVVGLLVDAFKVGRTKEMLVEDADEIHAEDLDHEHHHGRTFGWKRILMFACVAIYLLSLALGFLEHEHEGAEEVHYAGFNLLSEDWMNIMFAVLGIVLLAVLLFGADHIVEEHLWRRIFIKHLPPIFGWTFGILLLLGICSQFVDIAAWTSANVPLMILFATLIGIIPESGPHLVFITLFASGAIPFPVLLASCISQDGHAALPLFAESKSAFLKAKAINCVVALVAGFACWFLALG